MLTLRLPNVVASIRAIGPAVSGLAEWSQLTPQRQHDVVLATIEVVMNAIVHGNRREPQRSVLLSAEFTSDEIVIVVTDEGQGFDVESVPDPTSPALRESEGGRGLHTVYSLADALTFKHTESGHSVTIRFHRT
jgi:serine/threonine-protein kinase RsbW